MQNWVGNELTCVFIYLLSSVLILISLRYMKLDKFWIYSIFIVEFFIPFYGALAIIMGVIVNFVFERDRTEETEATSHFYLSDYEQNLTNKKLRIDKKDSIENIRGIKPYIDTLKSNATELKVDICIKLSRGRERSSIELLKVALKDLEYEVRYMANNALGIIEKEYLVELEKLSSLIEKFPTVMGNYIKRAETYMEMNQCGILDDSLRVFFLEKAKQDLQKVLLNQAFNPFMYIKLAYIYKELGDYKNLVLLTERSILFEIEANEKNKLIFFAVEGYFKLRNFKRVNELIKLIDLSEVKYSKISETVEFWRDLDASR